MTDKERFERIEINLAKLAGALEASTDNSNVAHLFGVISKRFVPHPLPEPKVPTAFQKHMAVYNPAALRGSNFWKNCRDVWNAARDAMVQGVTYGLRDPLRKDEVLDVVERLKEPVE